MECARCGTPGEWAVLHDVITSEGIVKLCKRCIADENAPVIKKPSETEVKGILKNEAVYKRLSLSAGIDPNEHRRNIQDLHMKNKIKQEEVSLRDLIDRKFDKFVKTTTKKREDLVDNYNWIIMRARRAKKMTTTQLAQEIGEPEKMIKLAEQGALPEGNYILIKKLEDNLSIRILKPEIAAELDRQKKQLGFDNYSSKILTLSDLQKMKKEEEAQLTKEPYWRRLMSKIMGKNKEDSEEIIEKKEIDFGENKEIPIDIEETGLELSNELPEESKKEISRDLSQSEIDDLIFGRK